MTSGEQKLIAEHRADQDRAMQELKARLQHVRRMQEKEKQEWVEHALCQVLPAWAVRQVLAKGRGWVCHLFRVKLDHWHFDKKYAELFIVKKGGKDVALKIFKWDDGEHLEGRRS